MAGDPSSVLLVEADGDRSAFLGRDKRHATNR